MGQKESGFYAVNVTSTQSSLFLPHYPAFRPSPADAGASASCSDVALKPGCHRHWPSCFTKTHSKQLYKYIYFIHHRTGLTCCSWHGLFPHRNASLSSKPAVPLPSRGRSVTICPHPQQLLLNYFRTGFFWLKVKSPGSMQPPFPHTEHPASSCRTSSRFIL